MLRARGDLSQFGREESNISNRTLITKSSSLDSTPNDSTKASSLQILFPFISIIVMKFSILATFAICFVCLSVGLNCSYVACLFSLSSFFLLLFIVTRRKKRAQRKTFWFIKKKFQEVWNMNTLLVEQMNNVYGVGKKKLFVFRVLLLPRSSLFWTAQYIDFDSFLCCQKFFRAEERLYSWLLTLSSSSGQFQVLQDSCKYISDSCKSMHTFDYSCSLIVPNYA